MQLIGTNADPVEIHQQFPLSHPFAKGKAINNGATTVAASGTVTADLITVGYVTLEILFRLGNATTPATAAADLNGFLQAYEDDGSTIFGGGGVIVPDVTQAAAILASNVAYIAKRYVLGGKDKVRVAIINNNVAALQGATAVYFLQK